jgi:TIR domain
MKPTEKSMAAFVVGSQLQMLNWKAFQGSYAQRRTEIVEALEELDIALEIPTSMGEFAEKRDGIIREIGKHLENERASLGGDCYALTMYFFGYVPLELVLSAAWNSENYESLLWLLKGILSDFGIDGEYNSLKHIIDVETKWLAQQSARHEGNVRAEDALKASLRLVSRIGSLWRAAEKLDSPVKFSEVPYHSVFISYSTLDEEFGQKLFESLDEAGMRVWFAPHDIRPGKKIHHQIYNAIEQYDKLLLVLSAASMKSEWVGTELYKARAREREEGGQMLFPVRLVPFETVKAWNAFDADTGKDLAREIREYFIPDFSNWRDESVYRREVDRLIEALMIDVSADANQSPPGGIG